jgi:hypothetical protein
MNKPLSSNKTFPHLILSISVENYNSKDKETNFESEINRNLLGRTFQQIVFPDTN